MIIGSLAITENIIVDPYISTKKLESLVITNKFVIVKDKEKYKGLITSDDLVKKPYKIAIDCISEKPHVDYNDTIENALLIMETNSLHYLPLFKESSFFGVVAYKDILNHIFKEKHEIEKSYFEIFNSINDAILLVNPSNYKIENANNKVQEIFNISKDEILKYSIDMLSADVIPYKKSSFIELLTGLNIGDKNFFEWKMIKSNSEIFFANINVKKTLISSSENLILVIRDITLKKQMEEYIVKAKDDAIKANNIKSQFLSNMSHEIRNPLNAIVGILSLVDTSNLTVEQKKYIDIIRASSKKLNNIVSDILDISKIEAGKTKIKNNPFNINDFMDSIIKIHLPLAQKKNINLIYKKINEIPDKIIGDSKLIDQILTNLLNNSIKFTQKGEIVLELEIIEQIENIISLKFSIIDSGIGIEKDKLNLIYDQFVQLDSTYSKKYAGTGLGLFIVKNLVDLLKGTIEVESKPNHGTNFSVVIPFKTYTEQKKLKKSKEDDFLLASPTKKILIVEDDEFNAVFIETLLNQNSFNVEQAQNGVIALEKYKSQKFDLIIMDIQMPVMNGLDCTKHIRDIEKQSKNHTPIIACTGYSFEEQKLKCIEAGMDDIVLKPINVNELFKKINYLLKI